MTGGSKFLCISYLYKLSWRAYENKLKTAHGHVTGCFNKLSQIVSQIVMSVDELK